MRCLFLLNSGVWVFKPRIPCDAVECRSIGRIAAARRDLFTVDDKWRRVRESDMVKIKRKETEKKKKKKELIKNRFYQSIYDLN